MTKEIEVCKFSEFYSKALQSLDCAKKLDKISFENTNISEAIYFHLTKMRYAGWKNRIDFNRQKKHSISDFFQDIIAFYLNVTLSCDYTIFLEHKIGKTQPDILIKRDNQNLFIIEVKTTIGWSRPDLAMDNPYITFEKRVSALSKNFKIPKENVIYTFENHGNVGKKFSSKFWDSTNNRPLERPTDFPFSIIYPLFNRTDPYYWKNTGINNKENYLELSDEAIVELAKENIVTPFEEVIKKIEMANLGN